MRYLYTTPRPRLVLGSTAHQPRLDLPVSREVFDACLALTQAGEGEVLAQLQGALVDALRPRQPLADH